MAEIKARPASCTGTMRIKTKEGKVTEFNFRAFQIPEQMEIDLEERKDGGNSLDGD